MHQRARRTTDPLHVLHTTVELIESLRGDTFDTITEARRRGATWEQIGDALRQRPDAVRCKYTAMVDYIATHQPWPTDLDRCREAAS